MHSGENIRFGTVLLTLTHIYLQNAYEMRKTTVIFYIERFHCNFSVGWMSTIPMPENIRKVSTNGRNFVKSLSIGESNTSIDCWKCGTNELAPWWFLIFTHGILHADTVYVNSIDVIVLQSAAEHKLHRCSFIVDGTYRIVSTLNILCKSRVSYFIRFFPFFDVKCLSPLNGIFKFSFGWEMCRREEV